MERLGGGFASLESKERKPEGEKAVETRVILEFMRHGKKESAPSKADEDILLAPEGRVQVTQRGKELMSQPDVSVAFGSPRKRSQETAGRVLFAGAEIDNPDMTLDQMEQVIDFYMKGAEKIREDVRLNFDLGGPAGKAALAAFKEGRYIPFLVGESDAAALEHGDMISTTYMRQAGNVAEIIRKYAKVGDTFHRIASKTDKYREFGNQLERYLGTHQGVTECFVAKALETMNGVAARDAFVRSVGSGFGETEGIRIEIINRGAEQTIRMTYAVKDPQNGERKETVDIDDDILKKIVEERKTFDEKVAG